MRRIVAPFLAALLAAPLHAAPASAVALNEEGIAHLAADRAADAVRCFEGALAVQPDSAVLDRNLAAALARLGEEARAERRTADAIRLLERAVRLHPTRLRYRVLLGRARFDAGDDLLRVAARGDFAWVLESDPDHVDALVNLAEILYLARELEPAIRYLRRAVALLPGDRDLALRLERAERELAVERTFGEVQGVFFLVRYSPRIAPERAQAVLLLCEEVRGSLATTYGSYPPRIVVTLYTPDEFRDATKLHGWVAGLSDGTIRLTLAASADPESLRATIRHEMTHHIVRGIAPGTPVWLHEGLAQIEEGRDALGAEARLRQAGVPGDVLSTEVLRQSDRARVALFYDAALAFAHYLEDTHRGGLQRLLRELGAGKEEAAAFRDAFGESREILFERWRSRLE